MPTRLAVALEKDSNSGGSAEDPQGQASSQQQRRPPPQPLQLIVPPGAKVAAITGPNTGEDADASIASLGMLAA